jgi:hypothetical protein
LHLWVSCCMRAARSGGKPQARRRSQVEAKPRASRDTANAWRAVALAVASSTASRAERVGPSAGRGLAFRCGVPRSSARRCCSTQSRALGIRVNGHPPLNVESTRTASGTTRAVPRRWTPSRAQRATPKPLIDKKLGLLARRRSAGIGCGTSAVRN